ncbi:hypothetical protein EDC04DRAFT_2598082 [Pisolithus marmoratus]|nr:hypothetical protein EDC04DRAFT_2598082 [Pisolithus marmoratus]
MPYESASIACRRGSRNPLLTSSKVMNRREWRKDVIRENSSKLSSNFERWLLQDCHELTEVDSTGLIVSGDTTGGQDRESECENMSAIVLSCAEFCGKWFLRVTARLNAVARVGTANPGGSHSWSLQDSQNKWVRISTSNSVGSIEIGEIVFTLSFRVLRCWTPSTRFSGKMSAKGKRNVVALTSGCTDNRRGTQKLVTGRQKKKKKHTNTGWIHYLAVVAAALSDEYLLYGLSHKMGRGKLRAKSHVHKAAN